MYFNVNWGRSPTWWYGELLYIVVSLCNDLMMATHSGPKLVAKYNTIIKQRILFRSGDRASWQILITKPTRCTNFSNLLWNETLHLSDSSSAHHQEFFTVNTAMVYVIQVCWHTIAVCTVKNSWWWTEELPETCRVPFQNKFEKLVHLVGFTIREAMYCVTRYVYEFLNFWNF